MATVDSAARHRYVGSVPMVAVTVQKRRYAASILPCSDDKTVGSARRSVGAAAEGRRESTAPGAAGAAGRGGSNLAQPANRRAVTTTPRATAERRVDSAVADSASGSAGIPLHLRSRACSSGPSHSRDGGAYRKIRYSRLGECEPAAAAGAAALQETATAEADRKRNGHPTQSRLVCCDPGPSTRRCSRVTGHALTL